MTEEMENVNSLLSIKKNLIGNQNLTRKNLKVQIIVLVNSNKYLEKK